MAKVILRTSEVRNASSDMNTLRSKLRRGKRRKTRGQNKQIVHALNRFYAS